MVIQNFSSKLVFLDTAPLIYFIEGHTEHQKLLSRLFYFITSSITLLEVLVKPLREGKVEIARQYKDILTQAPEIEVLDITSSICEIAAEIRAKYNLRTPDAIQVATSIEGRADYFLTNDNRLKSIKEMVVVTLR